MLRSRILVTSLVFHCFSPLFPYFQLLILLILLTNTSAFILSHDLNFNIEPCEDFHLHVCGNANKENFVQTLKTTLEQRLSDEALEIIKHLQDPILDKILEIVKNGGHRKLKNCFAADLPSLGYSLAHGKIKEFAVECNTKFSCYFIQRCKAGLNLNVAYVPFSDGRRDDTSEKLSEVKDARVKQAVTEFLRYVDKNKTYSDPLIMYPSGLTIPSQFNVINMSTGFEEVNVKTGEYKLDIHENLFKSDAFSPYFNLVYSKVLIEKEAYLPKERKEELTRLYMDVKEAIKAKISVGYVTH
ncbi:hypothetical protein L596_019821 [Steinernema carpocapsae]|uniref:Peptidase M13 N-terminal domain-containing protein n=1 Tax=Steinernema carpocapsae TaxID=34508 RepID=A0A4U5MRR4_STECR|nr:hypothetical protein L596_019821 [Steinernema carpocapsae]